ncbi:hypothetical protein [Mycoplasma sp. ATU-Cv-508]|uniref:hypothetical protein n=1 Tax=Mycoplasma sp. ATU-Cv-508 TaxID=2048001 RepID=UPI000FDEEF59
MKIKRSSLAVVVFSVLLFATYVTIIVLLGFYFRISFTYRMVLVGLLAATIVMLMVLGINNYWLIKRRRENIGNSYEFYVDDLINTTGVGVIIFSKDGEIIWVSQFVDQRFEKTLIGQDLNVLEKTLPKSCNREKTSFVLKLTP